MTDTSPNLAVAEALANRYLNDNDFQYTAGIVQIDPAFVQLVGSFLGGWAAGKALDYVYDRAKKKVLASLARRSAGVKTIRMLGPKSGSGSAVLEFGRVRPAFHIERGMRLVLSDVTIRYVGDPRGLLKEEVAPSFVPIRVSFVQAPKRGTATGLYQINTPIWVGNPRRNPYDMRARGGSVVVFDMSAAEAKRRGLGRVILEES